MLLHITTTQIKIKMKWILLSWQPTYTPNYIDILYIFLLLFSPLTQMLWRHRVISRTALINSSFISSWKPKLSVSMTLQFIFPSHLFPWDAATHTACAAASPHLLFAASDLKTHLSLAPPTVFLLKPPLCAWSIGRYRLLYPSTNNYANKNQWTRQH